MKTAIDEFMKQYKIEPSFYHRYIKKNAENRLAITQLEFMLWRRGRFIKPHEKTASFNHFIIEEITNFYEKREINLPQIQIAVTTRCTLQCHDCNAMIPEFNRHGKQPTDLSLADFQRNFDTLMATVAKARKYIIHGGEPLLNKHLPDIVDHSARHEGLAAVEIVTNGTIVPSARLIEVARDHREKVYFRLSNYSANEALRPLLKHDAIVTALKNSGIKHQISMNLVWNKEEPLRLHPYTQSELQSMFDSCWLKCNIQVFDGKLSLCPRLSFGYALGIITPPEDEYIDLRRNNGSLRQELSDFYQKSCFDSCRYCVRIDEQVTPAIQR